MSGSSEPTAKRQRTSGRFDPLLGRAREAPHAWVDSLPPVQPVERVRFKTELELDLEERHALWKLGNEAKKYDEKVAKIMRQREMIREQRERHEIHVKKSDIPLPHRPLRPRSGVGLESWDLRHRSRMNQGPLRAPTRDQELSDDDSWEEEEAEESNAILSRRDFER